MGRLVDERLRRGYLGTPFSAPAPYAPIPTVPAAPAHADIAIWLSTASLAYRPVAQRYEWAGWLSLVDPVEDLP
jgi:hypothetical protein